MTGQERASRRSSSSSGHGSVDLMMVSTEDVAVALEQGDGATREPLGRPDRARAAGHRHRAGA